ncbi:hypothetical protein PR048_027508, partial [Dryococelus australis]
MLGCYSGLQVIIPSKALRTVWAYCIIHGEALSSQHLRIDLNEVLKTITHVLHLYNKICHGIRAEYTSLLSYSSTRWLSRER